MVKLLEQGTRMRTVFSVWIPCFVVSDCKGVVIPLIYSSHKSIPRKHIWPCMKSSICLMKVWITLWLILFINLLLLGLPLGMLKLIKNWFFVIKIIVGIWSWSSCILFLVGIRVSMKVFFIKLLFLSRISSIPFFFLLCVSVLVSFIFFLLFFKVLLVLLLLRVFLVPIGLFLLLGLIKIFSLLVEAARSCFTLIGTVFGSKVRVVLIEILTGFKVAIIVLALTRLCLLRSKRIIRISIFIIKPSRILRRTSFRIHGVHLLQVIYLARILILQHLVSIIDRLKLFFGQSIIFSDLLIRMVLLC